MGFITKTLIGSGLTTITVSGINGILLSDMGKTTAVIAKKFYSPEMSYAARTTLFSQLKPSVQAIDSEKLEEIEAESFLMHARKSIVSISL